MIDLVDYIYKRNPHIKHNLFAAKMKILPHVFIKRSLINSFMYSISFTIIVFFVLSQASLPWFFALLAFPFLFSFFLTMQFNVPKARILKRGREIDNEILFAARFLSVKLSAGRPLFNALIDTSQSYGVASKYFKEIVDDINFGTPIEQALERAMQLSPSDNFKKLLFQISNALKVGVDVTQNLEIVIAEIEHQQILEIEKYGKKLSSIALFYMLGAIVVPSLGMTIFAVVGSFLSINIGATIYGFVLFLLVGIQLIFLSLFKQIRPSVNI